MAQFWALVVCPICREDLGEVDSLLAVSVTRDLHLMFAHDAFAVEAK